MGMKKERVIKIKDLQTTPEGEEGMEMTTFGYLRGTENDYTLGFEENFGDGMKSNTLISVKNQNSASIIRSGDITAEITVEVGKRHSCRYSTPFGDMMLGGYAQDVFSAMSRKGGALELSYTLDCNGSMIAKKQMSIQVSEPIR